MKETPHAGRWRLPIARGIVLICAGLLAGESALPVGANASSPLPDFRRGRVKDLAAGKFLVARRNLPDPNFSETVVLLAELTHEGAMGLVLNRRTDVPVSRVLAGMRAASGREDAVHVGGPVAPNGIVALMRAAVPVEGGRRVLDDVYLISERAPLESALAARSGPDVFRVFLGYAGWGASQLESETALGAWHVFSADADLVFDADPDSAWERQIRRTESLMAGKLGVPQLMLPSSPPPQ